MPALGTLLLIVFALASLHVRAFPLSAVSCFVLFGCPFLDVFSSLKRKWWGSGLGGEERWRLLRVVEAGKTVQDVLYESRICFQYIYF